jgi:hypothetical protein
MNQMHAPTLNQNLTRGMTGGSILSMQSPMQLLSSPMQPLPPRTSRRRNHPEEVEHLFHSNMWVKGSPLQLIVDSGSQKNLISVEVMKWLGLPTTTHPQPYTMGWLHQGRDLHVSQQCHLPYNIKPFTDEVLCDIAPLYVSNVLLGQPYLWK